MVVGVARPAPLQELQWACLRLFAAAGAASFVEARAAVGHGSKRRVREAPSSSSSSPMRRPQVAASQIGHVTAEAKEFCAFIQDTRVQR
jgi:hypothetical protein